MDDEAIAALVAERDELRRRVAALETRWVEIYERAAGDRDAALGEAGAVREVVDAETLERAAEALREAKAAERDAIAEECDALALAQRNALEGIEGG